MLHYFSHCVYIYAYFNANRFRSVYITYFNKTTDIFLILTAKLIRVDVTVDSDVEDLILLNFVLVYVYVYYFFSLIQNFKSYSFFEHRRKFLS